MYVNVHELQDCYGQIADQRRWQMTLESYRKVILKASDDKEYPPMEWHS